MSNFGFIDSDAHVIEPNNLWEAYLEPKYRHEAPRVQVGYRRDESGFGFFNDVSVGTYDMPLGTHGRMSIMPDLGEAYDEYARAGFPARSYLDAMKRSRIDYMVLYPSAGLYTNQAPTTKADTAGAFRRAYNNWLCDFCSDGGGRLIGAGALDLRDPEEAAREAERCVDKLGFKAVTINPAPVGPYPLFHPAMDPLWATIADLNVPVGVHVGALNASDPFLYDYFPGLLLAQATSAFSIGNMIACASFIIGGILERHPALRVVHLESGAGWAAFWLYRLQAGAQGGGKDIEKPGLTMQPIDYWRRQCYISADPDDPGIKQVIDAVGDDNIVAATDFGHPEGRHYRDAVEELEALAGVAAESRSKIMWDNALRLYPIETSPAVPTPSA
jgi:predicted TIM-barrel fold metal-dependent hydrolase